VNSWGPEKVKKGIVEQVCVRKGVSRGSENFQKQIRNASRNRVGGGWGGGGGCERGGLSLSYSLGAGGPKYERARGKTKRKGSLG